MPGDYQSIGFDPALFKFYTNSGATSVPGISSVPEPSSVVLAFISMGLAGRFVAMTHLRSSGCG